MYFCNSTYSTYFDDWISNSLIAVQSFTLNEMINSESIRVKLIRVKTQIGSE